MVVPPGGARAARAAATTGAAELLFTVAMSDLATQAARRDGAENLKIQKPKNSKIHQPTRRDALAFTNFMIVRT